MTPDQPTPSDEIDVDDLSLVTTILLHPEDHYYAGYPSSAGTSTGRRIPVRTDWNVPRGTVCLVPTKQPEAHKNLLARLWDRLKGGAR